MALTAAQLLDELMGRDRNLVPGEKSTQVHWSHDDVCKHFLCGFCANHLFVNTKADLGQCNKIHDEVLKQEYENSSRYGKMGFEEDFVRYLNGIQSDVERKIRRGHERLLTNKVKEQELAENDSDNTKMLTDHINSLLEEIEQLGSEGKVEEAQGVSRLLDQLKEEREQSKIGSGMAGQEKQMEVCEVCGAFLIVGDVQSRVDDHLQGKQHVGYAKIKSTIEDMKKKPWLLRKPKEAERADDEKDSREKERDREKEHERERERGRDREREREREKEREREREKEKERERERDREREKERENRSHSRRSSGDRSREKRRRSRSRSRDRHRERRDRSHDRSERRDKGRSDRDRERRRSRDRDRDRRDRDRDSHRSRRRSRSRSRDRSRKRSRSHDSDERRSSRHSSRDRDRDRSSKEKDKEEEQSGEVGFTVSEKDANTSKQPCEGEVGDRTLNNDDAVNNENSEGECSNIATQDYTSTASTENTVLDEPNPITQDSISTQSLRDDVANLPTQDYVSNLPTQDYTSNIFCTSNQSTPKYTSILPSEDFTSDSIDNVNFNNDNNDIALDLKQNAMFDYHSHMMQNSLEQDQQSVNKVGIASKEEFDLPFPNVLDAGLENDDYM